MVEFKQLLKYKPPFVIGHDVAGVVTQVGDDPRLQGRRRGVCAPPRSAHRHLRRVHRDRSERCGTQAGLAHAARGRRLPLVALAAWQILVEGSGQARAEGPRSRRRRRARVHRDPARQAPRCPRGDHHHRRHGGTSSATSEPTSSSTTPNRTSPFLSGYDLVLDSLGGENLMESPSSSPAGNRRRRPTRCRIRQTAARQSLSSSCCRS